VKKSFGKKINRSLQNKFAALMVISLVRIFSAQAEVRLPHVFSDHMVLQRNQPIPVWGWAEPGETVTVQMGETSVRGAADAQGKWRIMLPSQTNIGPFTLTVSGSSTVTFHDVLVGEVWLCSGQSNMEMGMKMIRDSANEIAAGFHPQMRLLLVPRKISPLPVEDFDSHWNVCNPETLSQGGWNGFSAAAYFFARELQAKLNVPVGVIESSWGGTRIEPWTPPNGFAAVTTLSNISEQVQLALPTSTEHKRALNKALADMELWEEAARGSMLSEGMVPELPTVSSNFWVELNPQTPTALYNGMIQPLVPYAIRGALWYQGESNHGEGASYTDKMKALIAGWRQLWEQGDFPFLYVQIAPFVYDNEDPEILPVFWEAQNAALKIPNTGMAVINDIGDTQDIHPKNKAEVGRRLALLALAGTYGQRNVIASGPIFRDLKPDGATLRVNFDSVGSGLASRDGKPLSWFEVIDANGSGFVPADARIHGNTIILSAKNAPHPVAMRFGWNKTAEPNLMNREGLPASAFRAGDVPAQTISNTLDSFKKSGPPH
jgi:sialate O-acetylesterase